MKMDLSHKDLVKLGIHELKQGSSLNEVEADFFKKGIKRKDAIKALEEIDYYNKREEALKAKKEKEYSKRLEDKKTTSEGNTNTESINKNKPSFWIYFLVFLVLVGLALFYYFYNNKF